MPCITNMGIEKIDNENNTSSFFTGINRKEQAIATNTTFQKHTLFSLLPYNKAA